MRKKTIMKMCFFLTVVLLGIGGVAQAITIEWVVAAGGDTWDAGWISLLESQGYTVNCQPAVYEGGLGAAEVAILNSRDLIICSRGLKAARYDDGSEPLDWSNLTTPMLVMDATATDAGDWTWYPNGSSVTTGNMVITSPSHPFFNGITPDINNEVTIITVGDIDVAEDKNAGNGTVLATTTTGEVWIAEWDAGVEYFNGTSGAWAGGETLYAGGPRVFFGAGLNIADAAGSDGVNLNVVGQQIFLNIVYEMLNSDYDRAPIASASDGIFNAGVAGQLEGYASDFEGAPLTIVWSQLDGPGTATFSDSGVEDAIVTFSAAGTYTLQISVDDGVNSPSTATCTCYVWDPADNALLAHWDFESLPDPNTLTDVSGNGFTGIYTSTDGSEPNVTTGVLNNGTSQAFDGSFEHSYWTVASAFAGDPNFNQCATGITIAAWVKMPTVAGGSDFPVIAAFDNDNRLQINKGSISIGGPGTQVAGSRDLLDGLWHHVAGVFDGPDAALRVYVDGALDGQASTEPGALFAAVPDLRVGNRVTDRFFWGAMDDLQIYNYPLSDAEIATLTSAGDVPVYVTAGEDQEIYFKNQPVQMAGELVVDDGNPASATLLWEMTGWPLGADPNVISINNPSALDTTVTFPSSPVQGAYVFSLTADDTVVSVSDAVQISITIPTCADVIADGLTLVTDLAGGPLDGEGNPTPDCRVDLQDFAVVAADWLSCIDPAGGVGCISPY